MPSRFSTYSSMKIKTQKNRPEIQDKRSAKTKENPKAARQVEIQSIEYWKILENRFRTVRIMYCDFATEILYPAFIHRAVRYLPKMTGKLEADKLGSEKFWTAELAILEKPSSVQIKGECIKPKTECGEKQSFISIFHLLFGTDSYLDNIRKFTWIEMDIWISIRPKCLSLVEVK